MDDLQTIFEGCQRLYKKCYDNLRKIITCCMPFELEKAKNFINESKKYFLMEPFEIDGTILDEFNASNLTIVHTRSMSI